MNRLTTTRRALLVSASFPIAAILAPQAAYADQTVTVAAATPTPVVNADIATKIATPDRNLKVTITSDGAVTGGGNVTLNPVANQGDGTIVFSNAGTVGAVDKATGAVTDTVGVRLNGAGAATKDNTLSASNAGLVTGGLNGTNFGGDVGITNTGTVFGGISANGFGNTTVTTTEGSAVRSGGISATSSPQNVTSVDKTTTTSSSGNVKLVSAGDVVSADGKTRGSVYADSYANTDVTVSGVAGGVTGTAGGGSVSVSKTGTAAAGKSVVVSDTSFTNTPGAATVTIGSKGDIDSVSVRGTAQTAIISGKVGGDVTANPFSFTDSTSKTTVTQDADGNLTSNLFESSNAPAAGASTVTIDAAGSVGGNVAAINGTAATITSTGAVKGNLTATATGAANTGSFLDNYDGKTGTYLGSVNNSSSKAVGKLATVSVDGGTVGGTITASGTGGASVAIAGEVTGGATLTSTGTASTSFTSSSRAVTDVFFTATSSKSTSTPNGGAATLMVAGTGSLGGGATVIGQGGATAAIAGLVKGGVTATSTATSVTTTNDQTNDGKTGALLTSAGSTVRAATGKAASVDIAKGGAVQGAVFANGDGGATITNAGTIGTTAAPTSANATSSRGITTAASFNNSFSDDGAGNTLSLAANKTTTTTVGGIASVTNSAGGLIEGTVNANGVGGATIVNNGVVRGTTTGNSFGTVTTSTNDTSTKVTLTKGKAPDPDVQTVASKVTNTNATTQIGGSVNGTYAGVNGTLNFFPAGNGSITQSATKDSVATVSGTVFGDLGSVAGSAFDTTSANTTTFTSVLDTTPTPSGTNGSTSVNAATTSQTVGTSTVAITGRVAANPSFGSTGTVSASGSDAAKVTVNGGTVDGGVSVTGAGIFNQKNDGSSSYAQTTTKGVTVTDGFDAVTKSATTYTSGAATLDLTGTATVLGNVNLFGNSGATATVGSGAKIGAPAGFASLSVSSNYDTDFTSSDTQSYIRDAKSGKATATDLFTNSATPSATAGSATATVAGTVNGTTSVNASRGSATATITGVSRDGVQAVAASSTVSGSTLNSYASSGKVAPAGTTFGALIAPLTLTSTKVSNTTVRTGGAATITIDSAQALKDAGTSAVKGAVNAFGIGGAGVTVTAGSKVEGSASANSTSASLGYNNKFDSTQTFGKSTDLTSTSIDTVAGTAAKVTNAGSITGSAGAFGTTAAEIANSGKLGTLGFANSFTASALDRNTTTTISDLTSNDAALRNLTTTVAISAVGGDAKFGNAAGASAIGNVFVSGKTGSATNDGILNGTTVLGTGVADYTRTTNQTASATTVTYTQPATLFTQTYTANQNGVSAGFNVGGATFTTPADALGQTKTLTTSVVNATINLNNGSATLGGITGQTDAKGGRLTNTTVNLNGAGFLGADAVVLSPAVAGKGINTPFLTLGKDAQAAGFTSGAAVRVTGVTTLNKTGAGTFVINGAAYVPPAAAGALPTWTLDVGNFNITGGEVQLAVTPVGANTEFGINGNLTNGATLVLGRRAPTALSLVGDSLVGTGPERINGITVRQTGNFTQSAAGTIVVGVTPALVRFAPVGVATGGTASEPLGPVTSGVNIPYFTTALNAGIVPANSRVNITGNLNLAGTVLVDVSRDSLFSTGDGYTLFSYTGTYTPGATVVSSITSPFVKFALTNDAVAKTVSIAASRTSYATGAGNPNAAAAAVALDSAIPAIVARIKTDAAGGAGFTTVSQIGYSQDLANVASALDFRLTSAQIGQVFDELSSAEIYGSLSSVNQNVVFGDTVNQLATARSQGAPLHTGLWFNPVASFARYGGTGSGASAIKVDSYGGALGLDFAYMPNRVFGVGGAYGEHDVNARGTNEHGRVRTYTIGAYVTQGFGPIYVNGSVAYGFSRFNVDRTLTLLARTIKGDFRGHQFDAWLEAGYDFNAGSSVVITPFAKAAVRSFSMDAFTETGGGGVGLAVAKKTKSIFTPVVGLKIGGLLGDPEGLAVHPYLKGSYTFMGDIGNDRSVAYLGGGDAFTLRGVKPDDYGTVEAGINGSIVTRVSLYLSGAYSFGGQNKVGTVRGGISFAF